MLCIGRPSLRLGSPIDGAAGPEQPTNLSLPGQSPRGLRAHRHATSIVVFQRIFGQRSRGRNGRVHSKLCHGWPRAFFRQSRQGQLRHTARVSGSVGIIDLGRGHRLRDASRPRTESARLVVAALGRIVEVCCRGAAGASSDADTRLASPLVNWAARFGSRRRRCPAADARSSRDCAGRGAEGWKVFRLRLLGGVWRGEIVGAAGRDGSQAAVGAPDGVSRRQLQAGSIAGRSWRSWRC